jgi:DNA repair protein RadC
MSDEIVPVGHRKRLRERFIKSGLTGFADYEVVELLLSLGTPRRDCKPQAKEAIKRFKTLRGYCQPRRKNYNRSKVSARIPLSA